MKRVFALAVVALTLSGTASAYYHFVHFASRTAPFRPMPAKFDLNVLPNKTLSWFVNDMSGLVFNTQGDGPAALLSQLKSVTGVWNDVDSSDLRLAYGGVATPGLTSTTPSVEVLFDLPPGVIAQGGPTVSLASNGQFVPIVKSVVRINPDFSNWSTWSERLYTTLVHEFGHALGLQHTFTSSVMSTEWTRSTGKSKPLGADDIAGLSLLYPKPTFQFSTGSVSGRVTMNGTGVNMASVVAIAPNGSAISTLTNPDGTWQIDGLPQRSYYVYVHPIPPAMEDQASPGGINLPTDATGRTFVGSSPFETIFYTPFGGVNNALQASLIPTAAGLPVQNINFTVRQRNGYAMHTMRVFAFPGNFAARPPFISPGLVNPFVVADGFNLPVNTVRSSTIGGPELRVRPYELAPTAYVRMDFDPGTLAIPSNGPRHVVFSATNDIYVLPSAFYHVERQPPVIVSVVPGTEGAVRIASITGLNLQADTRILFDGVPAQVRNYEELPGGVTRFTVGIPNAVPGHRAVLAAFTSDGQSSLSVQGDNPPSYTYPADTQPAAPTALLASPVLLSPGTEAMLQIDGLNTQFTDGQVAIGFGTPDVVVRRLWVLSPTRLVANVVVAPTVPPAGLLVTLTSGLQVNTYPLTAGIQPAPARPFWLSSVVQNLLTGASSVSPGNIITMQVGATPVPLTTANAVVVINDSIRVPVGLVNGSQVSFTVPLAVPAGLAVIRLEAGTDRSLPIAVQFDVPAARPAGEAEPEPVATSRR
ncbi:MAG: matrixin family metalloprotease [Bryobacteraceae bacterium]|nr:matrixin family metalloprotease [Bryobacteraceae bacterium]